MQLHYNILWIDNDLPDYEDRGVLENLNSYILDLGFKGNIVALYDDKELNKYLDEIKFDLIISDYELDNTTGIKVVERIRDKYLTEILFYTAKTSQHTESELRDSLKNIDRITIHLGRDTLLTAIEKLIKLTVSKLLELNSTRGLITSETSQLDVLIEDLVIDLIKNRLKLNDAKVNNIIDNYIDDFLITRPAKFKERFAEIGFDNIFQSIDANRKWLIFRDLLKEFNKIANSGEIETFLKRNSTYFKEVIDIRNKFAHSKALEKNGKMVLIGQYGKADFVCDDNECISIRKNVIAHRENFNELLSYFGL